jgi:putative Ca2+/H+ antiporter (TMEM165/GDT1 family)
MLDLGLIALVFGPIFLVELPDKTFVATLVLSTRYRPLAVWLGVGAAFAIQCLVAVTVGRAVGFLPEPVVHAVTLVIFCTGAFLLVRSAPTADAAEREQEEEFAARAATPRSFARAAAASFGVIFVAEWGDLSQLLTMGFVSRHGHPASVFVGAWAALLAVSGLAAVAGRLLLRHLRLSLIHYAGATVCLGLAGWSAWELVRGL